MISHRVISIWVLVLGLLAAAGAAQPEPGSGARRAGNPEMLSEGDSVQDTLRGELIVKAINEYCPTRKWSECLAAYYQMGMNPVRGVFLTDDRRTAEANVANLHARMLDELKKRMLRGALGQVDWGLDYQLTLNVQALDFRYGERVPGKVVKPSVQLRTGFFLESIPAGEIVFRQQPPLLVSRTWEPGAPAIEMGDLIRQTVDSVYDTLKTVRANLEKTD